MSENPARTRRKQRRLKRAGPSDVKEYLKRIPSPPKEHVYELKMEKRLKRMLKEENEKKKGA